MIQGHYNVVLIIFVKMIRYGNVSLYNIIVLTKIIITPHTLKIYNLFFRFLRKLLNVSHIIRVSVLCLEQNNKIFQQVLKTIRWQIFPIFQVSKRDEIVAERIKSNGYVIQSIVLVQNLKLLLYANKIQLMNEFWFCFRKNIF